MEVTRFDGYASSAAGLIRCFLARVPAGEQRTLSWDAAAWRSSSGCDGVDVARCRSGFAVALGLGDARDRGQALVPLCQHLCHVTRSLIEAIPTNGESDLTSAAARLDETGAL